MYVRYAYDTCRPSSSISEYSEITSFSSEYFCGEPAGEDPREDAGDIKDGAGDKTSKAFSLSMAACGISTQTKGKHATGTTQCPTTVSTARLSKLHGPFLLA